MPPRRICFMGASNVEGVGDEHRRGWAGRLTIRPPALDQPTGFFNLGVGGDTTAMVRARWRAECESRMPDGQGAIVFSFGFNDTAIDETGQLRAPLDETLANVTAILSEAKDWLPVLWAGPTPVLDAVMPMRPRPGIVRDFSSARIAELNGKFAETAGDLGVPFYDLLMPLSADPRYGEALGRRDGIHPDGAGYDLITDMLAEWDAWKNLFA